MKKRILLVNKSFVVGGIQSSMLNLINEIKDDYEIDVCVFYNDGQLKNRLPNGINVVRTNKLLQLHGMSISESKRKGLFTFVCRLLLGAFVRTFSNKIFFNFALMFQKSLKGYDVAIAYHHEDSTKAVVSGFYRFVDKKTDAPIRLGWIHYDPYNVSFDDMKNEKYMNQMTRIICVSKGTADVFKERHPNLKVPIDFCYNIHDVQRILTLSKQDINTIISEEHFNCFSACRFSPQKDMPRAINALAPVIKKHKDVRWYIAGDGPDVPEVKRLIEKYGIGESVILLGSLSNPYPYFSKCDLYIQPSIYEAAPMVYGEAIICRIPIFTTENISAQEMVPKDYGIICENSLLGLRLGFEQIMFDRSIIVRLKNNLKLLHYSNEGTTQKLDSFFMRSKDEK